MEASRKEYLIDDLTTKSVTLYPTSARIVRDLNNVWLLPGQNEIEIYGLTPTLDDQSVQIDGKGLATITDIAVELVANRETFADIYPEPDQDPEDDDDTMEYEPSDEVSRLEEEVKRAASRIQDHQEAIQSATRQLETLDKYVNSLTAGENKPDDVVKTITMYEAQRSRLHKMHCDVSQKLSTDEKSSIKLGEQLRKAKNADHQRHKKQLEERMKELQRKKAKRREEQNELQRVRAEKLKFFPKKVYKVTINLEAISSIDTPALSRRGSLDSVTLAPSETLRDGDKLSASGDSEGTSVSLALSYVTRDARWTPRYDIHVSSVQKSAAIVYRAELVNETSETWKDTQLFLSSSQTSYGGLEDKAPTIKAWHVTLSQQSENGLLSPQEIIQLNRHHGHYPAVLPQRHELFGSSSQAASLLAPMRYMLPSSMVQQQQPQQPPPPPQIRQIPQKAQIPQQSSFVQQAYQKIEPQRLRMTAPRKLMAVDALTAFDSSSIPNIPQIPQANIDGGDEEADEDEENALTVPGAQLDPNAPAWSDDGLTSTYEVSGQRTLAPSSRGRRQHLASLSVRNISITHVAVPKLRTAAFLRVAMRNPSSSVTLLKGTAGVTLDGSFLGNTTLARVAPGRTFELPLGVDPGVSINYPKPSVLRSTLGVFTKEAVQVFTRNVWITNSNSVAVEIAVSDQVPVSQDERLQVAIVVPRGLQKNGDAVKAGNAATEGADGTVEAAKRANWGRATAAMKKDGQITWTVHLEKKQACLLKLEYETKMPAAEHIVPAPALR